MQLLVKFTKILYMGFRATDWLIFYEKETDGS